MRRFQFMMSASLAACSLLLGAHSALGAACDSEIDKFCRTERPVLACLRKNEKDLSPTCNTYVRIFERMPSCLSDARKLCPTDKPSASQVIGCLRGKEAELSEDCRKEIAEIRG